MSPTPFEKLFPSRSLFAGRTALAWLWGVLGGLALCVLLIALGLLLDLWIHRGELNLRADDVTTAAAFLGEPLPAELPTFVAWTDLGLGPTAWRERENWAGRTLAGLLRHFRMPSSNRGAAAFLLFVGIVCALLRIALRAAVRHRADEVGIRIASSLRSQLHRQTLRLGPSDLAGERADYAQRLFTDEVDSLRNGISDWLTRLARDVPTVVLLTVLAALIDWRLFFYCLVPLIGCWWIVEFERRQGLVRREQGEANGAKALRLLSDSLRKSRLVRGYGMENFEHDRFQKHLEEFTAEAFAGRELQFWSLRVARLAVAGLVAMMLFFVGAHVLAAANPLPAAAGFLLLSTFVAATPSVGTLLHLGAARTAVNRSGEQVFAYINEIPEVGQAVGAKFVEPLSKTIIFESVTYRRSNRDLLQKLDLRIPAGKMTAIVSVEPLAARTAAYMLPRFVEPQQGRVLFDSEDIAWGTLDSLRTETAYVGGADHCFNGTVLENIVCGESRYSVSEATDAAKMVHAHNFILKLPRGYETMLGDFGERLDAGQAFRLGLARAALRKPALVIVEEPESLLDESTKDLLDDSYQRIASGRTVVFLPTRLSTLKKCDLIVLLAEGKVASIGTHAELLKTSELYRHWEYVSFNSFRKRGKS
jgi:ABC-type multidrug transport system fused ATPase/permease subunit